MADGWDDDDLGLLDDESSSAAQEDNNGWGDDGLDLLSDSEGKSNNNVVNAAPSVVPVALQPEEEGGSGWGDEDDDLFGDEDEEDMTTQDPAPSPLKEAPSTQFTPAVHETVHVEQDREAQATPFPIEEPKPAEGWGDDEDEDFFDDALQEQPPAPPSPLAAELSHYILALPAHASSIQSVLAAEYNTHEKAMELYTYYAERPQLLQYTIEKEIPRMDYVLIENDTDLITEKEQIQYILSSQPYYKESLAARCANQSLLADVLQVLTGPDRVVRPHYLATAVASHCRFQIQSAMTQVVATLELSLPLPQGGRWKVAEIFVMVVMECTPPNPTVNFRVADIVLTAQDQAWHHNLQACAVLLQEMRQDEQAMEMMMMSPMQQQQPGQNFRDVFLQSQSRLQASASEAMVGMKSAWKDLDAATGLGHKLRTILPDNDVLAQAEAAQAEAAQQHHQQQQRPTSILGGLVRSLAKSVALPEEDPSLYHQQEQAKPASLYRREEDVAPVQPAAFPKLYNTAPRAIQEQQQQPKNAQGKDPSTGAAASSFVDKEQSMPESSNNKINPLNADDGNGWDEDLSFDDDDDGDTQQPAEPTPDASTPYDPVTDIRPTRKRWIHPNPHARRSLYAA